MKDVKEMKAKENMKAPGASMVSMVNSVSRERLASLELELAARETELAALGASLQELQARYLSAVGEFYAELVTLGNAIFEAEIRAGIRKPAADDDPGDEGAREADAGRSGQAACPSPGGPSTDLKALFRNLAKTLHPDRALRLDEPERWRRHSLMAEANRAYAERDEDRLRLILHAWERAPESAPDAAPEADDGRARRRVAYIDQRLVAIEAELVDLRTSAIGQLQRKIDDARAQ